MASQELIPFSDEENRELGLGPYAATATPEGGAIAAGGIIPFTGTELVEAVEGDPSRQLGYEEFERYRRAKSVEPEKTFDEKLGIVGQGLEMVGEEFFGGIWSAVSQGLYLTDPLKGIKTLVSGSARGGTDMFHIIGDIFTKDFHAADTYEKYLEDTGSEDDQDSRQDYIRQLSKDKMRFNLKRAYEVEREKWRTGETKTTLPLIGEIEGEDVAGAEAFGYVGDFTMAIPAAGAFTKLPSLGAKVAGKVGGVAGKAVGGTGRGVTKVTDAIGEKVGKVIPEASQTTARVLGIAGSTVSGQPAIGLALAAPTIGRSLDVAGRLGEKVGESLGKRPSQFGVLERVAMDSTVDPNLRKLARILHMGGAGDKLLSGTGTLALGVGTGMVVGGGLGYLAQGEEGMLQGIGAGIGIGGPAALGGAGLSKLTGHARRSAEDADVMRFLEAQAKKGVDPKQAFAKLGRDALLKTATLERIFQGDVAINLLTNAQYNKAHKAGAAAWSPERKSIDINIEASDVKGRRQNILHEFGHALWDSPVVNKSEMTAELVGVYGQTRIDAMATNYVERLAENRVRRRFKNPFSKAADDAVQRWKEGKPTKGVDDFDVAVNAERADLTKQFGLDWVHSEIFAEDFVGSTLDRNLNKLRKGKTGEDLFHLRGAMLRTKAAIQRKMGGKLDPLGRVDGAYASRIFGDMTGDKKFKKTLRNYIRDRGRHFDEMSRRAKNPDGGGTKQDILNMGDRAGFWRDKGDGTFENDFATKNAKGEVTVKGHDEIAKTLHDRAEGTRRLREGLVAKGLIGRDDKTTLGAREGADGSIEVTGKAIPDEVIEASNLPPQMKEHLKLLNELVGNGTTAMVWYNGISTTKSKKIKMNEVVKTTKDGTPDLRGTTRMWRRNLRKFMGNIAASRRDIKPFEYRITKEGNITVQSLDVDAIHDKVSRWQRDTDANGRPKLELWGNDVKRFYEDLKIYMDNHRKGLGGAEGIGEAKRNAFRAFLMRDMTGSGGVSPMHDILNNRPVDRTSIVKSFRLDRIGSVESTMREDFHFDYHKVKENLMPDGTPKVKEHGEVIEFNEAMAERFMPVAPEGARYMDFRDMQQEKMVALSIDRLGHGVRELMSGASSEIAAQGGRAFMWLEGKWASYDPTPFKTLFKHLRDVGTEYVALSMLGELNHNNTRYGLRLFGESVRDAVARGDITKKHGDAYIKGLMENTRQIAGMQKKALQTERDALREIRSVQQFIDAVDSGKLTHRAGEAISGQRGTKGTKFNFNKAQAEELGFGPSATARMGVDKGLWDEKKFPIGTVVAVMKVKADTPIIHEPNLHYHYGHTIKVEPVAYAKEFYPLSSLSSGISRAVNPKTGELTGGNVFGKDGSVGPQPLQTIVPELDLLTAGKMGPPIDHPVNYMPETIKGSTDPVMGQARRDNVTGRDWDAVVDRRSPVSLSPIPTKRGLVPDQGLSREEAREAAKNFKKGDKPLKASLQMLSKAQRELIGAARQLPAGERVGLRQDIPFLTRTRELAAAGVLDKEAYAVAIHAPNVRDIYGYDSIARIKNVTMFISKAIGGVKDINKIAEGRMGKFPMATVEGEWVPIHDKKGKLLDDAIPADLHNPEKWLQVGMDPHRHEYFYRKDNHSIPIESASEAISVGNTVFVRADDVGKKGGLVEGDRSQHRYFPAETARMESDYMDAVAKGDVDTMQAAVDQAAARAGYDTGPVYHGRTIPEDDSTPANRPFTEFDPTKNAWGHIMTSDSEDVAKTFAGRQMHVGDAYGKLVEGKGDIVKGYLKLDNPFDYRNPSHINDALYAIREWGGEVNVSFEGEKMVKLVDELERRSKGAMEDKAAHEPEFNSRLRKWIASGDYGFFETAGVTELLKKLGHDGYITTERGGTTYAAFESNQIKSADPVTLDDGGNPIPLHDRFNMESDDIRYIPAYHGTPHTFAAEEGAPLGRFSTDKIGTGEGAQAYGHGLYFAEKKSVAEWYRDKLTDNRNLATHSNVEVKLKNKNLTELGEQGFSQIRTWIDDFVVGRARYNSKRTSVARAKQYLKEELIPKFKKSAEWDVGLWTSNIEIHGEKDFNKAKLADAKKALSAVESLKPDDFDIEIDQPVVGSMYEVDITPKEEHFLDLDKPFKEQSKYVKDALLKGGKRVFDAESGSDLYLSDFVNDRGQGLHFVKNLEAVSRRPSDVSARLANIGIAGNRFADASSRATTSMGKPKEGFKQTYNYVVFEDSAVEIKNRYMPRVSEDGKVVTIPTKGRIVQTGPKKFRAYNLSGKLMGVAATQAAADALLNRGKN